MRSCVFKPHYTHILMGPYLNSSQWKNPDKITFVFVCVCICIGTSMCALKPENPFISHFCPFVFGVKIPQGNLFDITPLYPLR